MVINYLEKSIEFIETNLFLDLSVETCAAAASYSTFHYCRLFSSHTGMSVREYINKRRVSEAAKLIKDTELPLKEIGYRCGFNSQESFTRVFKRVFHLSPRSYRQLDFPIPLLEKVKVSQLGHNNRAVDYFSQPEIRSLSAFKVAGKAHETIYENGQLFKEVPMFWNQFYEEKTYMKLGYCEGQKRVDCGVSLFTETDFIIYTNQNQSRRFRFDFLTGVKIPDDSNISQDLVTVTIPEQLYAIFESQPANEPDFIQELINTWRYIDYYWLPNSPYEYSGGIQFNEYEPYGRPLKKVFYVPIRLKNRQDKQINSN